jgi:hypothetical protein
MIDLYRGEVIRENIGGNLNRVSREERKYIKERRKILTEMEESRGAGLSGIDLVLK